MTIERMEVLANYMKANPEKTKRLLEMDVEAALKEINADGNDFTVEELQEMDKAMVAAQNEKTGELGEEDLEAVAGGVISVATASLVVSIVSWGAPYAWKAGQWIGKKIVGR